MSTKLTITLTVEYAANLTPDQTEDAKRMLVDGFMHNEECTLSGIIMVEVEGEEMGAERLCVEGKVSKAEAWTLTGNGLTDPVVKRR
jgi:hypothetical protein